MIPRHQLPSYDHLAGLMSRYTTKGLVHDDPVTFKRRIDEFLELRDSTMEGYRDPTRQRDLSIRFHWGHTHDFGDFKLNGRMGDRHIALLATYIDHFRAIDRSLAGKRVLDIGCWTGGTSLLLCAMGAEVVAVEEVRKYTECLRYLKHAFGLDDLEVRNCSLYDCAEAEPDFDDAFDIVLFAGVIYHVSDPVIALRITFNALKDDGVCLLETQAIDHPEPVMAYYGPQVNGGGTAEELNRWGWDWYVPSPATIMRMMIDTGFQEVRCSNVIDGRSFAVGRRKEHVDLMRAGLSVRDIR